MFVWYLFRAEIGFWDSLWTLDISSFQTLGHQWKNEEWRWIQRFQRMTLRIWSSFRLFVLNGRAVSQLPIQTLDVNMVRSLIYFHLSVHLCARGFFEYWEIPASSEYSNQWMLWNGIDMVMQRDTFDIISIRNTRYSLEAPSPSPWKYCNNCFLVIPGTDMQRKLGLLQKSTSSPLPFWSKTWRGKTLFSYCFTRQTVP